MTFLQKLNSKIRKSRRVRELFYLKIANYWRFKIRAYWYTSKCLKNYRFWLSKNIMRSMVVPTFYYSKDRYTFILLKKNKHLLDIPVADKIVLSSLFIENTFDEAILTLFRFFVLTDLFQSAIFIFPNIASLFGRGDSSMKDVYILKKQKFVAFRRSKLDEQYKKTMSRFVIYNDFHFSIDSITTQYDFLINDVIAVFINLDIVPPSAEMKMKSHLSKSLGSITSEFYLLNDSSLRYDSWSQYGTRYNDRFKFFVKYYNMSWSEYGELYYAILEKNILKGLQQYFDSPFAMKFLKELRMERDRFRAGDMNTKILFSYALNHELD